MGKINKSEALEMLRNGTTQTEVATHFGVSRQAITPLARELESGNVEVMKHTAGRKPASAEKTYTFEDMIDLNIKALEALSKVPALEKEIERLNRENETLRRLKDREMEFENAVQQGRINPNFTEHILHNINYLRLSIDITHLPIFIYQDSCYSDKSLLLCSLPEHKRKEYLPEMASVEERLGGDAEKAVKFAKHFGIPAAKQLYGQGIGNERFREFIESRLGPDGTSRPMFNLYGTTGGADPLQFFFYRLSEIIIEEIQKRDSQINLLKEKLDAVTNQAESLKKFHNHRDIAPEIVEFTNELAEQVKRI